MTQVGTPMWMAPEIIMGKKYTEKADVYAFGIILWEILTRLEPYEEKEPMQIVVEVVNDGLRPTLPADCAESPLVPLMKDCVSEDCQLLTNRGFLFLDQVKQIWNHESAHHKDDTQQPLQFASYNPSTKQIEYQTATDLIVHERPLRGMVHFSPSHQSWPGSAAAATSGVYGTDPAVADPASIPDDSDAPLSLHVTRGHDMYVSDDCDIADKPSMHFAKRRAEQLLFDGASSRRQRVRMLANADGGLAACGADALPCSVLPCSAALGLSTQQSTSFLQLYASWLAYGCFDAELLQFRMSSTEHVSWLESVLSQLPLRAEVDWHIHELCVCITAPAWVAYFTEQESSFISRRSSCSGCHSSDSRHMWSWTLQQLGASEMRELLVAYQRVCSSEQGALLASSICLREDLLVACLHAGYAAHFTRNLTSSHAWAVHFTSDVAQCQPVFNAVDDVRADDKYNGRVWCVTVPPHHLLIARRAVVAQPSSTDSTVAPQVVHASRPLICGNCWHTDPQQRPSFEKIVERLRAIQAGIAKDDNSPAGIPGTSVKGVSAPRVAGDPQA